MLVTRVGGLPEMVPDGKAGYVVEPSVAAIAMGLIDFCNNPDPTRFAAGIAEQKKKYAWSTMTRAILS
jgi:glycosyltransferase involved in cell wall biosynthesis